MLHHSAERDAIPRLSTGRCAYLPTGAEWLWPPKALWFKTKLGGLRRSWQNNKLCMHLRDIYLPHLFQLVGIFLSSQYQAFGCMGYCVGATKKAVKPRSDSLDAQSS